MIDAAQVHPTFFWHSSLLMHEYPSKDWVNPVLQLPHNTPLRLPLQRLSLVRTSEKTAAPIDKMKNCNLECFCSRNNCGDNELRHVTYRLLRNSPKTLLQYSQSWNKKGHQKGTAADRLML
jgi:hypothetical protein